MNREGEEIMSRYLSILEVSQKQAYIFASNKLKDNIRNSAIIEKVLSPDYILETFSSDGYSDEKNMVYSGGGHTILEFLDYDTAKQSVRILTERIYKEYDGLEVFAKIVSFNDEETAKQNISRLISELEKKKAIRKAAFHQGSYGIEAIDTNTLNRICLNANKTALDAVANDIDIKEKSLFPDGFDSAKEFENLGGSKGESNFIAVVHIDGNGMGKRVEDFYEMIGDVSWEETKKKLRQFSEGIACDFETAYKRMLDRVADSILQGKDVYTKLNLDKREHKYFPIRRVITAGDDVCFVTEGRIGIECARIFIEELTSDKCKNSADGKGYTACAGVAIVHQKYPFYRAYELAEMLCSNAKRYGATISPEDNGRSISAIDWHVEFGELKDSLTEIRSSYDTEDGNRLELRPYIIKAPDEIMSLYCAKQYKNFKRILSTVISRENGYATGKIKNLRNVLKEGSISTKYYLQFNRMTDILVESGADKVDLSKLFSGETGETEVFVTQSDGVGHSLLFDAIEILDTFISID